ncbi:unnamed protein product, partial [marine sediment metagenome]
MAKPRPINSSTKHGDGWRPAQAELERRMLRDAASGKAKILPQLEVLIQLVNREEIPPARCDRDLARAGPSVPAGVQ